MPKPPALRQNPRKLRLYQQKFILGFRRLFLRTSFLRSGLVLLFALSVLPPLARAQDTVFKTPAVRIPLDVKDTPITITAWATLALAHSTDPHVKTLALELNGDLSDLQRNLTPLLNAEMDKDDRCADSIAIQNATLSPAEPAALAVVQLHYERRACIKMMGKQESKRLVAGNAQVQIKLTPQVTDESQLQLVPDVGDIQADGSLGELLRAGPLGDAIREKVRNAILKALQKGTNFRATLPPVAQDYAPIQSASFRDAGDGRLLVTLDGEVHLTQEQIKTLRDQIRDQLKQRLPQN